MRHFPFYGQDTMTPKLAQVSMRTPSAPAPYFFLTPTSPVATIPPATVLLTDPVPPAEPGILVPLLAAGGLVLLGLALAN